MVKEGREERERVRRRGGRRERQGESERNSDQSLFLAHQTSVHNFIYIFNSPRC